MGAFVIFGDSTCDLEKTVRDQYGIGYVPMRYIIDDTEYIASLEWESHSAKEFYDLLRSGKRAFTTQVPKDEFEKAFRCALEQGQDVLYIACSSALSGSINTARVVARNMGGDGELASGIVIMTTLCSSVTLTAWIFILRTLGLL